MNDKKIEKNEEQRPNNKYFSPVNWYLCSYLSRFIEINQSGNFDDDKRFVSWENTVIIEANSIGEAYDKTVKIGIEHAGPYKGGQNAIDVQWYFMGVTEVIPIYEELVDGAEIAWTERKARKLKNLQNMIYPKEYFTNT